MRRPLARHEAPTRRHDRNRGASVALICGQLRVVAHARFTAIACDHHQQCGAAAAIAVIGRRAPATKKIILATPAIAIRAVFCECRSGVACELTTASCACKLSSAAAIITSAAFTTIAITWRTQEKAATSSTCSGFRDSSCHHKYDAVWHAAAATALEYPRRRRLTHGRH